MASFSIGCMTCSSIVARCMDRTRKLKRLTIILLTTSIVGNILYTITYSVWFPIFGRLLCGMTNTIRSCYMGKISNDVTTFPILAVNCAVYASIFVNSEYFEWI